MAQWILPAKAIVTLAEQHNASGRYTNFAYCLNAAEETVMARLVAGALPTIANYVHQQPYEQIARELRHEAVPISFWREWNAARATAREADWVAGDFRYEHDEDWTTGGCWGKAFEVRFDAHSLSWMDNISTAVAQDNSDPTSGNRGRKPANWWPDFAEELAMWCLLNDPPEGNDTSGQSDIIDAIFRRMAERGKAEPSRTTIQPVINAVLRRFRSAGK